MLKLLFYNVAPPASVEIMGEAFTLAVDTIFKVPPGEAVAKYAHGEWCLGERCFLRIECAGAVICRLGRPEESGGRHGPYRRMQLIDGVLVAEETPLASLHPGRGWIAEPNTQVWACVYLESAPPPEINTALP